MTEKQLEKKAKEWVKPLTGEVDGGYNENDVSLSLMKNAFIAGAHSRDEEIKELQDELESLRKGFYERGDKLKELMLKNNQLRNPWISVEERLPKEDPDDKGYSVEVIGIFHDGSVSDCFCSIEEGIWFIKGLTCDRPTHWMHMPELKKGE